MGRQYLYTDGPEDQNHHEHRSGDRGRALVAPSFWSARITGEYQYRPLTTYDVTREGLVMDKDRIKGSFKQFSGRIKEAAGKLLGDKKTESKGKAEKTEGEIQNAVGSVKDTVRETISKK
jgi:uncharacterized protein YjbJ (UPF0337 family)